MKVVFIQPPLQDFYSTPIRRQPLGLLYLASLAKQQGWEVALINGHSPKAKKIPLPLEMDYLKPYIDSPNPIFPFKHFYHFGLSFQEIKKQIKENPANLYAISSLFTPYYQEVDKIMEMIQEIYPHTPIVVGGGHATLYPSYYLDNFLAQFVILGEGEQGFINLLSYLKTKNPDFLKIPSLLYRNKPLTIPKTLIPPLDLDAIPMPQRDLLNPRDFKFYGKKGVSLLFSRGCPHGCSFCVSSKIFGKNYRNRNSYLVIQEIEYCVKNYQAQVFNFEDDNFFSNPFKTQAFLEQLLLWKQKNNLSLDFTAMNGLSIENMNEEHISLLKKVGFQELNFSLAVFKKEDQKQLARPFDTPQFEAIVKKAVQEKINVRAYFILGLPHQTYQDIMQTLNYLKSLYVKPIPSVYYQVVGMPQNLWKIQRSSAFANQGNLSRQEQIELFNLCLLNSI